MRRGMAAYAIGMEKIPGRDRLRRGDPSAASTGGRYCQSRWLRTGSRSRHRIFLSARRRCAGMAGLWALLPPVGTGRPREET